MFLSQSTHSKLVEHRTGSIQFGRQLPTRCGWPLGNGLCSLTDVPVKMMVEGSQEKLIETQCLTLILNGNLNLNALILLERLKRHWRFSMLMSVTMHARSRTQIHGQREPAASPSTFQLMQVYDVHAHRRRASRCPRRLVHSLQRQPPRQARRRPATRGRRGNTHAVHRELCHSKVPGPDASARALDERAAVEIPHDRVPSLPSASEACPMAPGHGVFPRRLARRGLQH